MNRVLQPYFSLILFAILIGYAQGATAQDVITTIAGDGSVGITGDGGPATSAKLNQPSGVFVDGGGNVFIADQYNNKIRKIAATNGYMSTVAGTGSAGYTGDSALAAFVELYLPASVYVNKHGDIYIADCYNNRIRKVDTTTGWIYTIAGTGTSGYSGDGGAAANAKISYPTSIVGDTQGNLYFVDYGNSRIRKILPTGAITTIAGSGTPGFSGDGGSALSAKLLAPSGVCIDNAGNVYIADEGNNRVRMVSSSGIISTFAGNGTAGFSGDGGPATSASLKGPQSVWADATGNIYVADMNNHRIRKINTLGIITTVAGNGTAGYSGEWGTPTNAELNTPAGVFVNSAGNIFMADKANNRVRKISPSTGVKSVAENNVAVYPNPNKGVFTIEGKSGQGYTIYNLAGKAVCIGAAKEGKTIVDINTQPNGIYLLHMGGTTQKIMVQ